MTPLIEKTFQDIRKRELENHASVLPTLYIVSNDVKKLFEQESREHDELDFISQPVAATMFGIRIEYGGTEEECRELALIRQIQGERPTVVAL